MATAAVMRLTLPIEADVLAALGHYLEQDDPASIDQLEAYSAGMLGWVHATLVEAHAAGLDHPFADQPKGT